MVNRDVSISTLGQLLALLAHDLRNPLSAIHSNVGFLASILEGQDEEVSDALSDGLISCDGLSHIIDNIDLLGHVLREASGPSRSTFDPVSLVTDMVARCAAIADSHRIGLRFVSSGEQYTAVYGARDVLGKALGNLIRNSVQHSAPGQVVNVQIQQDNGRIRILVDDHGTPITVGECEHLFTAEGQVRAKSSADGRYSRGLGLYAARLAAELGGGSVAVSTAQPERNVLVLELPCAPNAES